MKAWSEQGNCETPGSAFILLLVLIISKEATAEGKKRKGSSKCRQTAICSRVSGKWKNLLNVHCYTFFSGCLC